MSRYIDADAIDFSPLKNDFDRARAKVVIMGQPTADVVEVVRCRDCNYYKLWDGIQYGRRTVKECCRGIHRKVNEDDYCSYGERREENDKTK